VQARAMWKGVLLVGEERVAVKLFSGIEDRKVHFRLLSAGSLTPVRQRMVSSRTGKEVPDDKVRKGLPTDDGRFVMLTDEELASLEPEPSRDIQVTRFLDPEVVDPAWYERPYYLGPDGDETAYAALAEAMKAEEKEGIARWVMRKKAYAGALRAEEGRLVLITLRHAGEVVPASALPEPGGRAPEPQEIRMAEQLITALAGDFDPSEYRDEYRDRVLAHVRAKAEGRTPEPVEFHREPALDEDLTRRLEESLAAMKKRAA
jgi:DNA end-binding protein Ku